MQSITCQSHVTMECKIVELRSHWLALNQDSWFCTFAASQQDVIYKNPRAAIWLAYVKGKSAEFTRIKNVLVSPDPGENSDLCNWSYIANIGAICQKIFSSMEIKTWNLYLSTY